MENGSFTNKQAVVVKLPVFTGRMMGNFHDHGSKNHVRIRVNNVSVNPCPFVFLRQASATTHSIPSRIVGLPGVQQGAGGDSVDMLWQLLRS